MLQIKKGKKKTQVFKIIVCDKCGAEYIYIESAYKLRMKDIFTNDDIYVASVSCTNCNNLLRVRELTNENYKKELSDVLVCDKNGVNRKMTDDEMFMFI